MAYKTQRIDLSALLDIDIEDLWADVTPLAWLPLGVSQKVTDYSAFAEEMNEKGAGKLTTEEQNRLYGMLADVLKDMVVDWHVQDQEGDWVNAPTEEDALATVLRVPMPIIFGIFDEATKENGEVPLRNLNRSGRRSAPARKRGKSRPKRGTSRAGSRSGTPPSN